MAVGPSFTLRNKKTETEIVERDCWIVHDGKTEREGERDTEQK